MRYYISFCKRWSDPERIDSKHFHRLDCLTEHVCRLVVISALKMSHPEEKEDTQAVEEIDNLQMSRGEKPEPCDFKFNFAKARDMFVLDEGGNKIRFGDIYKHQKTIVIFSRVCFYSFIHCMDMIIHVSVKVWITKCE